MIEDTYDSTKLLRARDAFTKQLAEHPYSSFIYSERGSCYESLGYPDLAIGDIYRALLLSDEVVDESGEYHEEALAAYAQDLGFDKVAGDGTGPSVDADASKQCLHPELIASINADRSNLYVRLSLLLLRCGCLRSAYAFAERCLGGNPEDPKALDSRRQILQTYNARLLEKDPGWNDWSYNPKTELPEQGHARREFYPWNDHEPDRFSDESLRFLNQRMKQVSPKSEVRAVSLPVLGKHASNGPSKFSSTNRQLGVFATDDILPHETILQETSLLTANNRLHDPLCDACSAPLPPVSASEPPLPSCSECDDIVFCSQRCYDAAMSLYHPAVCGKPDFEAAAKDPSPLAATNALYLLLLGRTFAMSETQNIHPLDLPETKYLWGDFAQSSTQNPDQSSDAERSSGRLPFTFEDNILTPLHLLQKMDINIFTSLTTTDTWVIATLFAKFRGVASARMDPRTGMPEVCAVHPMWCLANHSCAPNVKWEWVGDMKLTARGGEDVIRWGPEAGKDGGWKGGIKKGDEVLSHYCDVGLRVKERREWAEGALGGMCVCNRCVWEEAEEQRKEGTHQRND
ncbi:MAG: hypothetical protein Q9219_000784 [cf. Caloplaca sp. 3 TL-2023]